MTLRHMKIFLAVCNSGCNVTRAAEAMLMTQPAVSLAIKELEEYYGIVLFDRIGRRLKLSEAGQHFQEYATHICSLFSEMEMEMRSWDRFGLIRVGASITIGSQFLPSYVKAFNNRYPGAKVQAMVGPSDQLEQKILRNELDFALIEGISSNAALVCEKYMEDYLAVICPANGQFRQGQILTQEEFRQQPFLLREPGSGTREVFEREIARAGFSASPIWEAMSTTALVNAVINGLGIAVLPHRMILGAVERGLVITVGVKKLSFRRHFNIIYHKEKFLSFSAKAFMELCRNFEMDYPIPRYNGLF